MAALTPAHSIAMHSCNAATAAQAIMHEAACSVPTMLQVFAPHLCSTAQHTRRTRMRGLTGDGSSEARWWRRG